MRTAHLILAAAVMAAAPGALAYAETGAVLVYGKAGSHERQVVGAAITRTIRAASWTVSESPFSMKESEEIVICLERDRPWPCVAPTATAKGIQRIVVVEVAADSPKSVVVTGQILLDSSAVPSIERRYCAPCSDTTLDQSAKELVDVLLERATAREGNTAIDVRTVPPGASITIDGTMSGQSDKTIVVSAGQHQVQLQRSGYRPYLLQVTVAEGQTFSVNATLVPAEVRNPDDRPSRLVPGVIIGAGALALITGSVYSFSADPPKQSFEQSRFLYSGVGLAAAAAGGAAVGVGLYLWFHHPKSRSVPVVSYANGGGLIGWSSSF